MQTNYQLKELKEKIKNLSYNKFFYRNDLNIIEIKEKSDDCDLFFDIWRKTSGENWGNCSGIIIKVFIGKKYIKLEGEFYATNQPTIKLKNYYISEKEIEEIINLLEESSKEENEIDKDYIMIRAILKLYLKYYE